MPQTQSAPPELPCPVEDIARAYLRNTEGDAGLALRCAIADALSDLMAAEQRARARSRLISRGYVRGGPDAAARAASDPRGAPANAGRIPAKGAP